MTTRRPPRRAGSSASSTPRGLCSAAPTRAPPRSSGTPRRSGRPRDAADDLLHASFEHPDVRLAGVHVGRARLEREPVVAPSRRSASTISVVLPTPCSPTSRTDRRPRRRERADERIDAAIRASRRASPVGRSPGLDDPPELAEEVDVDRSSAATPRARAGGRPASPRRRSSISSPTSGCRPASSASSSATVSRSPRCDARVEEERDLLARAGCRSSPPRRARAPPGSTLPSDCRRARGGAVAARPTRRARSASRRSPSTRRRRAPGGDRGRGAGAEELRASRSATSANVSSSMLAAIGEQLDEPCELVVVVELVDVQPRGSSTPPAPARA